MELLETFKSGLAIAAAVSAVLVGLRKAFQGLMEFHDGHWQRRSLKKLTFLAEEAKDSPVLLELISGAREEEIFQTIMGRRASPRFIAAVSQLWKTSKFSWAELRAAQSYLEVHDGRVRVSLGWWATFLFWFSLSAVIIMGVYVAVSITPLLRIHSLGTYAAIALLIGIYVCFAWFIGRDARDVAVARRVKAKIEALPAPMLGAEAEAPTPAA